MLLGGRFSFARRRPLYSTCSMNLSGGWPLARMRAAAPGVMEASATRILGSNCRGLELALLQLGQEAPVQGFGVGQQKHCQAVQVDAELIAQYIGCVGQFRRYFREWHLDLLSATRGKALGLAALGALPTGLGIGDWGCRHGLRQPHAGLAGITRLDSEADQRPNPGPASAILP